MSADTPAPMQGNAQRYEAVLRISEALVACRQPEELAKTLADLLNEFLSFEHLDVLILKEGSMETEWHAWGKGGPPLASLCRPRMYKHCQGGIAVPKKRSSSRTGIRMNDFRT